MPAPLTDYVGNRIKGIETLVVIPFWEEIERFNTNVRPVLRRAGLLGEADVMREAVKPLTWTAEQKTHWNQYKLGDWLLFSRETRDFKRGLAAEVIAIFPDGLRVRAAGASSHARAEFAPAGRLGSGRRNDCVAEKLTVKSEGMTLPTTLRKPKLHFDTAANPSHVTFDDGRAERRNLPWLQYVVTRWHHADPDTIKIEIGDCLVVVRGHNLLPLFQAIEDRTLTRVRAQPDLEDNLDRMIDSFATEIRFALRAAGGSAISQPGQIEFNLGE